MSVVRLWWLSLSIFTVVVGVVAALLGLIAGAAKSIDRTADGIWTVGKQIAGNTVSIWMLEKTNEHLVGIGGVAGSLVETATAIDDKLRAVAGTLDGRS